MRGGVSGSRGEYDTEQIGNGEHKNSMVIAGWRVVMLKPNVKRRDKTGSGYIQGFTRGSGYVVVSDREIGMLL